MPTAPQFPHSPNSFPHRFRSKSPFSSSSSSFSNSPRTCSKDLLYAVIEGLPNGILIMTTEGTIVYSNGRAREICRQLRQGDLSLQHIAAPIWESCQVLIDNQDAFPDQPVILEDELQVGKTVLLQIRTQWINLVHGDHLLITLEDRQQSALGLAIAEAKRYHLTQRETDVWRLHKTGYAYKEIAAELYIAINTVKKHMKSIYAKRQESL